MDLAEYRDTVGMFVFESFIDIPHDWDIMVDIVAVQFYENNIPVDAACRFAELIIEIQRKSEFDLDLEYEPFHVVEGINNPDEYLYKYESGHEFESFSLIIDGIKRIDISYKENLSYSELIEKINTLDALPD